MPDRGPSEPPSSVGGGRTKKSVNQPNGDGYLESDAMVRTSFLIACFAMPLFGCEVRDKSYTGTVDQRFVEAISPVLKSRRQVSISSGGGSPQSAYRVAREIRVNDVTVAFPDRCLSACSEFFIPATQNAVFGRDSLLGFHGSDLIAEKFYRELYQGSLPLCGTDRLAWLRETYEMRKLKPEFSEEVVQRLGIHNPAFIERASGCVGVRISYGPAFWFPTSEQLRTLWGLDTRGPICADREACWRPRLIALGHKGDTVIVGDQIATL